MFRTVLALAICSAVPLALGAQEPCDRLEAPSVLPPAAGQASEQAPVLLSTTPDLAKDSSCDCKFSGGSTGLRPGIDCLPAAGCDTCCRRPRVYCSVEYLLQWFKNQNVPPLVVLAPRGSGFGQQAGVPGQFVLAGGDSHFGGIDGIRATTGYWLDRQQQWALEASGFLTEQAAQLFGAFHDGAAASPVILGRTDGTLAIASGIGVPGLIRGGVTVAEHTRLWSAEGNLVRNLKDHSRLRADLLGGFRYMDLDESLDVFDTSQSLLAPASFLRHSDVFDARTQFYGGQIGARSTAAWGRAALTLVGKLGMGVSHLAVDRGGLTESQIAPGIITAVPLSTLVNGNNCDTTDRFAVLAETTVQVSYHWTRWLETSVGYNLIYLTSAVRAGDQVNQRGIDGSDFYANGITFGVACRY